MPHTQLTGNWEIGIAIDTYSKDGGDDTDYFCATSHSYAGSLINDLKYRGNKEVLPEITRIMTEVIQERFTLLDAIIPVPSSTRAGFDTTHEICVPLGRQLGIPVYTDILMKKETEALKNVDDPQRRQALLEDAFTLAAHADVSNEIILLVDDVYRTGATLRAATRTLKKKNAGAVYVLTLAKTRSCL